LPFVLLLIFYIPAYHFFVPFNDIKAIATGPEIITPIRFLPEVSKLVEHPWQPVENISG